MAVHRIAGAGRLRVTVSNADGGSGTSSAISHLPSEESFQALFLPHQRSSSSLNLYYVVAHYNVLLLMLAWLIWRHRDRYREARTVIALATFACLAVQLDPGGPAPAHQRVTASSTPPLLYGQSVYGPVGQGFSDQYSAMPSVHIAWSSAVAFFIWRSTKSRWRYIGVAHALLTWTVVIATGNHYWADGIVAIAILALSFWTVRLVTYLARPGVTVASVDPRPRSPAQQRRGIVLPRCSLVFASSPLPDAAARPVQVPVPAGQASQSVPTQPLTGLPLLAGQPAAQRPALFVKIENAPQAQPQTGLDKADVVYEADRRGWDHPLRRGLPERRSRRRRPGALGTAAGSRHRSAAARDRGVLRRCRARSSTTSAPSRRTCRPTSQPARPPITAPPTASAPHNLYATASKLWAAARSLTTTRPSRSSTTARSEPERPRRRRSTCRMSGVADVHLDVGRGRRGGAARTGRRSRSPAPGGSGRRT